MRLCFSPAMLRFPYLQICKVAWKRGLCSLSEAVKVPGRESGELPWSGSLGEGNSLCLGTGLFPLWPLCCGESHWGRSERASSSLHVKCQILESSSEEDKPGWFLPLPPVVHFTGVDLHEAASLLCPSWPLVSQHGDTAQLIISSCFLMLEKLLIVRSFP